ncbi:MAG: YIP1 family protein [Nitrosopumilus sp.]|nr:YIP1 family protein [Nitrosopumilus sp.]
MYHRCIYTSALYFDPNVILRVITAPNSAFAQVRDNEEKYFAQSIGLLVFTSILGALLLVPFIMIPLDDLYFEGVDDDNFPTDNTDVILFVGINTLNGLFSAVLFYFIGKKIGGNTNWKKVFSVIFHTHVPLIPMSVILSILLFLMMDSIASIDSSLLIELDEDEEQILSLIGPMLGYVGLFVTVTIAFVVWIFVVSVKAVKTVNGFGTAKAFGLIILVMIISSIVTAPFGT